MTALQGSRTVPRIGAAKEPMPARGHRPGHKIGRHGLRYWIATQLVRAGDLMGFPDRCIALPVEADDATIDSLCQGYTARLFEWIDAVRRGDAPEMPRYTGTMYSACDYYQRHPRSPFRRVKPNTQRYYAAQLKIIQETVGGRAIPRLTVFDVEDWYEKWREPEQPDGPERVDRAHDCVSMVRTVINFVAKATRDKHCNQLAADLEKSKFEKGGAREEELTYAHTVAFLRAAQDLAERQVITAKRALYMSIGVAAQFELGVRQKDAIGEFFVKYDAALKQSRRAGVELVPIGSEWWFGFFTWERIPGWRWRMKMSKSKYRSPGDFDLQRYGLLFPLLEAVPHDERTGAIVKGEQGLPMRESSYRKWFRQIGEVAGIPQAVQLRDSRAGAATEAEEAAVPLGEIQAALGHSKSDTTKRYIRQRSTKIANVADARARKRAADAAATEGTR